jgi:outer membrane protein TolC
MKKQLTSIAATLLLIASPLTHAESFTLHQTLKRVVETYPSIDIARMQVARAQQEIYRARSIVGWNLGAQAGASHDISPFSGTPSDSADLSASLTKPLTSGGTIGLSGNYSYEDSSFTFGPTFPNPSHFSRVDANYRMPLAKGAGNPQYQQAITSAEAGTRIARANELTTRDQLAGQTMELFYGAAAIKVQIATAKDAIDRAQRLKKYIQDNARLGLSEEKDLLQAEAQLQARLSDYDALMVSWEQQRTAINRLLDRPRTAEFDPVLQDSEKLTDDPITIMEQAKGYSPDLKRQQAQIEISDAIIEASKDEAKSQMDLVFGVGYGNKQGPATPPVNESDYAASVRLEYSRPVDKQGVEAVVTQAVLDRSIALRETQRIKDDLEYNVRGLVAEIGNSHASIESHRKRVTTEQSKFSEALQRYRTGREDTRNLIQFENELQLSKLALEQQRIELSRRNANLDLLRGQMFNDTPYTASETDKKGEQ